MLHVGLGLSRGRLDVCLLSGEGEVVEEFRSPADLDGLEGLARWVARYRQPVRAVIESMTGARFVHDTLERLGWDVLIADGGQPGNSARSGCALRRSVVDDGRCEDVLPRRDDRRR